MAKRFLELNVYFGVGGVLTFKNSRILKDVVSFLPLDHILLETDSPYLAPEPFRGSKTKHYNFYFHSHLLLLIILFLSQNH